MWAFGTSPYGLGLTDQRLWGLSQREYDALKRQWERSQDRDMAILAAIRADLHNTSARMFERTFEPADFLPGAEAALETKVAELVAAGYSLSQAAAMATSRHSKEHNLHLIDGMKGGKARPKRRA